MRPFHALRGTGLLVLLFLSTLWFLNFAGRTILSPVLPIIEDEFLISHGKASSIFIFLSAGYAVSIFCSGLLSGMYGYKKSIVVSLLVTAFMFFLMPFVKTFSVLYALAFVIGLATGIYIPAVIPLITTYYDERIWSRAIAIHDSAASLGVFAAPLIAVFLLRFLEWRWVLGVMGFVFFGAAIIVSLIFEEIRVPGLTKAVLGKFIRSGPLWLLSIIWVFAASTSIGVYYVTPLFLTKELNLEIGYANTIFGLSRLGGFAVAISSGFLVARYSIRMIMMSILIISGASTVFVALADTHLIGVALFLQASFIYGFFPAGLIAISRIFPAPVRSLATGFIFGLGVFVGWGITPYLLGLSGDHVSFRFGICALGVAVILSSGLVYLIKALKP